MVSEYLNKIKDYSYIELIKCDYNPFHENGYIRHSNTFESFIVFFVMFYEMKILLVQIILNKIDKYNKKYLMKYITIFI